MNDYEKTIEVLQNRVRALEQLIQPVNAVSEPVKWQPKGGDWVIDIDGDIIESVSDKLINSFGVVRQTKAQAERAAVEMRRFNRLLALRDELCSDEVVVDWSSNYSKYQVFFSHGNERWYCAETCFGSIDPHFSREATAQKACDMLNSGEVEL